MHDLFWKFYRQVVSLYDRHNVCPRIIDMTNDLNHFPFRFSSLFAVVRDLDHDLMSADSSFRTLLRNKNIWTEFRIVRHGKSKRLTFFISTYDSCGTAGYNFCNRTFPAFSTILRSNRHLNRIHMKRTMHLWFRDEDIFLFPLDADKSKTSCMRRKCTD